MKGSTYDEKSIIYLQFNAGMHFVPAFSFLLDGRTGPERVVRDRFLSFVPTGGIVRRYEYSEEVHPSIELRCSSL